MKSVDEGEFGYDGYKKERVGSGGRENFKYSWIGLNNSKNT